MLSKNVFSESKTNSHADEGIEDIIFIRKVLCSY